MFQSYMFQSVFLHVVDLAKPVDVHKFTTNFVKGQNKLDVLVRPMYLSISIACG